MRKAPIFAERLLAPSETFIVAQMQALRCYRPKLIGLERHPKSLPLEEPILLASGSGKIAAARAKIYRRTGIAPLFHHKAHSEKPALMHAHFASGGRSAMALARSLRVPLVVTLHGADVTVKGAGQRYKELMEAASAFICVSEFIRSKALAAGFPASKLIVHYIGVDRSLFVPADGAASRGVLFVGRFVEKKGCEFLVRAMQSVQRVYPDAELTMIGDGPLRPQHEALARELGVRSKFLGILPSTLVREHLRQACIFCAPSVTSSNGDSEGLPTVLAEAQASGIPVVATKHAGIPEIIEDGGNGILVDERNAVKLAEALMLLFRDDALYRRFREAGIQNVEQRFDLITQTARLEQIYDSVLK